MHLNLGWICSGQGRLNLSRYAKRYTNENNRQGGKPDKKTTAAGYQKLPHKYRPKAGCDQRDPIRYEAHPYPSMKRFAGLLVLRFNTPRTRHSYYRRRRNPTPRQMTSLH